MKKVMSCISYYRNYIMYAAILWSIVRSRTPQAHYSSLFPSKPLEGDETDLSIETPGKWMQVS